MSGADFAVRQFARELRMMAARMRLGRCQPLTADDLDRWAARLLLEMRPSRRASDSGLPTDTHNARY